VTSDEGANLKGTDLAPFPLAFFTVGLISDCLGRIGAIAKAEGLAIDGLEIEIENNYSFSGSFFRGTGYGVALPAKVCIRAKPRSDAERLHKIARRAIRTSLAMEAMRTPLASRFAVYANGRRIPAEELAAPELLASLSLDLQDPELAFPLLPLPCSAIERDRQTHERTAETADPVEFTPESAARVDISVLGIGRFTKREGETVCETWLQRPPGSRFTMKGDERSFRGYLDPTGDSFSRPSGLAHFSAGVAFCFMTQLSRYVEHRKYAIKDFRLVQTSQFDASMGTEAVDAAVTSAPFDTHLFVNGDVGSAILGELAFFSARTCYLHAALSAQLPPEIVFEF
jgi:uncharacterized OsmC-like protein